MGWFLLVRAFTPLGAGPGASFGTAGIARADTELDQRRGFWRVWGISALVAMAFLAEKLHHEYYWLLLAPVAAVGVGRCAGTGSPRTTGRRDRRGGGRWSCSAWIQVRSTWRTPAEWNGLEAGGARRRDDGPARTPGWSRPRRSCSRPTAAAAAWSGAMPRRRRAAGEWGAGQRRSKARSIWSNTIAARGPAISPTWAAAMPT